MYRLLTLVVVTLTCLFAREAQAQFGLNSDARLRSTLGYQPRTHFEPTLRTHFEPSLRAGFGFDTKDSATQTVLSQRLNLLQARLPEEKKYIADVITYVQQKKLSLAVVNDAFFYSVRNYPTPLAFSYFEQILRIKATRLKQPVPAFDRSIYNRVAYRPQQFNQ